MNRQEYEGNWVPQKKMLVIARDYLCFKLWCDKNGLNPKGREVVYISDANKLRGWDPKAVQIIEVCDWYNIRTGAQRQYLFENIRFLEGMGAEIKFEKCTP